MYFPIFYKVVRDVKIGKNSYIYVKMSKKHVKYRTFVKSKNRVKIIE